ncbi:tRNA-dependent cyclodipeptide synthase [Streptomyces sp. NPDC050619]|uniref:tRNA-dependent cyclodipeptide synthase n=1 Tax=Streptomyces sp. NPDC050619 TaxID=3157214 RepID=UPI00343C3227
MTEQTTEHVLDGRTKASFGQNGQKNDLSGRRAILLISVGQRYHEGDKLRATVELLNRTGFGQVTVAVADTLQRTNYLAWDPVEAHRRALREGDAWLERNSKILGRLSVPNGVLRWDEALQDPDYPRFLRRIRDAYRDDPGYRGAVDSTIRNFIDRMVSRDPCVDIRKAFDGCLSYLIEECPIIQPMWAHQGYDHVVYPQPMTAAMAETHRLFVAREYPGKGSWLSLRFKKRAAAPAAA